MFSLQTTLLMRRKCSPLVTRGLVSTKWLLGFHRKNAPHWLIQRCDINYLKVILFKYSVLLGRNLPGVICSGETEPTPHFPETNCCFPLCVSVTPTVGNSGKGKPRLPGCSWPVEWNLSASQCCLFHPAQNYTRSPGLKTQHVSVP